MAVVAFRLDSHCDGISKHMECQSNRHKHHPLSENDGQPLYAFVYPSCALFGHFSTSLWNINYTINIVFGQFLYRAHPYRHLLQHVKQHPHRIQRSKHRNPVLTRTLSDSHPVLVVDSG